MMLRSTLLALAIGLLGWLHTAAASGNYGPDTCLEGWVWREAYTGDVVCVTPEIRSQTAADNAAAHSRVNPNGGPYGPDTCLDGYVWREADSSDHVCVIPATRTQAAADNAQEYNRRASLNVWLGQWFQPNCEDVTCEYPSFIVYGDHFNFAHVTVGIYRSSDNSAIWTDNLTPSSHAGYVAGSFIIDAPVADCAPGSSVPPTPINAYVQVYDSNSDRSSTPIYVHTGCLG